MKYEDAEGLREALAALEHEQWAHWTKHMLTELLPLINPALVADYKAGLRRRRREDWGSFPPWLQAVHRWERQIKTPYSALTEAEKDSNRERAVKVLEVVFGNRAECPKCRAPQGHGGGFPCESGCDDEIAQITYDDEE